MFGASPSDNGSLSCFPPNLVSLSYRTSTDPAPKYFWLGIYGFKDSVGPQAEIHAAPTVVEVSNFSKFKGGDASRAKESEAFFKYLVSDAEPPKE